MVDIVDPQTRSRMMSGIRGKNTKPEMTIRKGLHGLGFRYRLHVKDLPGKPDIVLPRYGAVIFVHGCFWHGHGCHLHITPQTRTEFWKAKIEKNRQRDVIVMGSLEESGWRVLSIWECSMRGKWQLDKEDILSEAAKWIRSGATSEVIMGRQHV